MLTRFSVVTLVFFILSITFVIYPVHFYVKLPRFGRQKVSINLTTAPILAIAILWAAQCLGAKQIRDGIVGTDDIKPYNILILFSALAYMAITLDITGVLQSAAFWVSNQGGSSGWRLYLYFYIMLTVLGIFMGNDAVILSGTVFLVYYTAATGLEPMPWLISEFATANTASMVLFVGNITNVVVCEGFAINNLAFTAYTILPFLGCTIFCYVALAIQFRSKKHVPRRLATQQRLDPRSVLRDPVGATVGSLLFGACLAVILIVSFFNVDVWIISLPFAVAKLIFDFGWDYYRFTHGMSSKVHHTQREAPMTGETGAGPNQLFEEEAEMKHAMHLATEGTDQLDRTVISVANCPICGANNMTKSTAEQPGKNIDALPPFQARLRSIHDSLVERFPTFFTALPRLPIALIPFSFSQFILIEALSNQGWIEVFADWFVKASHRRTHPAIWLIGVLGVLLCNVSGTNIGATILLTKVVRAAPDVPDHTARAAGISLAIASNIGAVSFTFSASLAGLLWHGILKQKGITITQRQFAFWNMLPILFMTVVGLGIVSAEIEVLYRGRT